MDLKRPAEGLLGFARSHPDLEQIRNDPAKALQVIDDFSANHDFLVNVGSEKGRIVTDLIAEQKPKVLVELGGYVGYSSILFAQEMREQVSEAKLWSLEFDPVFANIISELVDLAGLSSIVTVVTGPADESMRRLKAEGKLSHIDMLFLDHMEDLYEQDLRVAMDELELLKSGSCVVADNVLVPGAPEYRKYVRDHAGLSSRAIEGLIMPGEIMVCMLVVSVFLRHLTNKCRMSWSLAKCYESGKPGQLPQHCCLRVWSYKS